MVLRKTPNNSLIRITKLSKYLSSPRFTLCVNLLLFIIASIIFMSFIQLLTKSFDISIVLLSVLLFILYFVSAIISFCQSIKLDRTINYLKEAHLRTKSALMLNEDLHVIKHDFSNIVQCMGGYIINNDMNGLKKYYESTRKEFSDVNNLSAINSSLITDYALYNLISSKYSKAKEQDVCFNINISVKFDNMQISSYKLTRILGILLDNAIEAARKCDNKEIYFDVSPYYEKGKLKKYIISIQNTYINKDVNVDKIREKGYTSKSADKGSHGLGLWEVNKIMKKSKNLNLHTTKNDDYFIQELEIYSTACFM